MNLKTSSWNQLALSILTSLSPRAALIPRLIFSPVTTNVLPVRKSQGANAPYCDPLDDPQHGPIRGHRARRADQPQDALRNWLRP